MPGIEQEDRKWRVGPCDQERDIGVIDPSPERFRRFSPFHPMVERARGEEETRGEGQDPEREPPSEFMGDGHQSQARHERERGHDQVDDPSKLGLWDLGRSRNRTRVWLTHAGILSPAWRPLRRVAG